MTPLDHLIEQTLPGGLAIAQVVAERVRAAIKDHYDRGPDEVYRAIRRELLLITPVYAEAVKDSLLAAWLSAAVVTAEPLFAHGEPLKLPVPPPTKAPLIAFGETKPVLRLPFVDSAAHWLEQKKIVTAGEFEQLTAQAKRSAFTVARVGSTKAIETIRTALVDSISEGGTLKEFRRTISTALESSPLSPNHVETIYRTNLGLAYSAGQQNTISHPLVFDQFPYMLYSATHDSRVRPEHHAMEVHGIQGGPVYRADDPVLIKFYPPWSWNCRCVAISLSLKDAAERYGIDEAEEWLATGVDPKRAYVEHPPWDLPKGWVPVREGQFAIAV